MTSAASTPVKDDEPPVPAALTIRLEHDRRRLLLRVAASGFVLLAVCAGAITTTLHMGENVLQQLPKEFDVFARALAVPWWSMLFIAMAVVTAAAGVLSNVYRLQDADPALVVSPQGLSFRATLFGEISRIPWTAIRGVRTRRYKHHRFLVLQVAQAERFVAQLGFRARLNRCFSRAGVTQVSFSSPMSKEAWARTEGLVQRYFDQYGTHAKEPAIASTVSRNTTALRTRTSEPNSGPR